jgi:hypothetical protein
MAGPSATRAEGPPRRSALGQRACEGPRSWRRRASARRTMDVSRYFPEVVAVRHNFPRRAVIDGEIAVLVAAALTSGPSSSGSTQLLPRSRLERRVPAISRVETGTTRSPRAIKNRSSARDMPAVLQGPHPLAVEAARPDHQRREPADLRWPDLGPVCESVSRPHCYVHSGRPCLQIPSRPAFAGSSPSTSIR